MNTIMTGWQLFILVGSLVAVGWLLRMIYQWEVADKENTNDEREDTDPEL